MEEKIIIIGTGSVGTQTFHNLIVNDVGELVHINQNDLFEQEPILIKKLPIVKENKIHYDKYGKILTNKGSKFHK
jgi:malate/lactate dehydrogenase